MIAQDGEQQGGGTGAEPVVFTSLVKYSLSSGGQKLAEGDASARLTSSRLSVLPHFGEPLTVTYRDVLDAIIGDYDFVIKMAGDSTLTLSRLGYMYEDFVRAFTSLRNEVLLKDLLMDDSLRKSGVRAQFLRRDESGKELVRGKCQLRLYETGVVLLPDSGDPVRLPYSFLKEVGEDDVTLDLKLESGDSCQLSSMGEEFEPVASTLSRAITELGLRTQTYLKGLLPDADPPTIWRAARLMRDGRAASKASLDAVSPAVWPQLEKKLDSVGVKEEFDFLKALALEDRLCIGTKRGLMGDLTGDYVWFLVPMWGIPPSPGNAVAMEASTGEGGGRATYFFRVVDRTKYKEAWATPGSDAMVDAAIRVINASMLEVNFRREPVYLSDSKLDEPRYSKYRFAAKKLSGLRTLRDLYIGRVVHVSSEQWKRDVTELLKFNADAADNSRWRSDTEPQAEEVVA